MEKAITFLENYNGEKDKKTFDKMVLLIESLREFRKSEVDPKLSGLVSCCHLKNILSDVREETFAIRNILLNKLKLDRNMAAALASAAAMGACPLPPPPPPPPPPSNQEKKPRRKYVKRKKVEDVERSSQPQPPPPPMKKSKKIVEVDIIRDMPSVLE